MPRIRPRRWCDGARTRGHSDPAHRFDGTDAAIARLDRLLAALPRRPADAAAVVACGSTASWRFGIAFAWKRSPTKACALRSDGPLPPYAEEAYADALLYLRRPEEASAAYRRVLAGSPKDVPDETRTMARYGLFYASVELEDFDTAYATIDSLVDDEPIWRTYQR